MYIWDFIHGLCMHHELDEEVEYVFGLLFKRPTAWYNLFLCFMVD
jgi:hypothetical protein